MPRRGLALTAIAAALLAAPAAPAATRTVPLDARAAAGKLTTRADFGARRTVVRLSGRVRVRRPRVQVLAVACADARCRRAVRRRGARRRVPLARGARRVRERLVLPRARAVLLVVRHGRSSLARVRMLPPRPLPPREDPPPPGGEPPVGDPPAGDQPAGGPPGPEPPDGTPSGPPSELAIASDPPLEPAYSPGVPDYGVRCAAGEPVRVDASVPAGTELVVDGKSLGSGASEAAVALSPGQAFRMTVRDESGGRTHLVRCLPPDLPRWTSERDGTPQARWYVFVTSIGPSGKPYVVIADAWGVPVWWRHYPGRQPVDAKLLPDGRVAIAPGSGRGYSLDARYELRSLAGELVDDVAGAGVGLDFHDLQPLANGNWLVVAYKRRDGVDLSSWGAESDAAVLDSHVQELTADGQLVWEWNSAGVVALSESERHKDLIVRSAQVLPDGRKLYDILHINSVEDDGDGIVISLRWADAIYRIRRADGAVDWKLGGTARPESLALVGDDPWAGERLGDQHDARVLPDGTVTLHDNAQLRSRPPHALRYEIDPLSRTATLRELIADPRAPRGGCCGSARKLSGGNWVVFWGGTPVIAELTPAGDPVLTLTLPPGVVSYRADPAEAGPTREQMHAGMDAQFPREEGSGP